MTALRGGKTLGLSTNQIARRVGVIKGARKGVQAAGEALKSHWEAVLRSGSGQPGGAPAVLTGRLAGISGTTKGGIRVTPIAAKDPTVMVGTPVFYGRILHDGVPGRIEPMPHAELALGAAEQDMNAAFRKAMR